MHRSLLDVPNGRNALNTPALVLDLDVLERNIATMASFASASGVSLRPHAKTHKSAEIARLQRAAGAVGVCCAKLGEAEGLSAAGIDDILVTSPVVSAPALRRLAALRAGGTNVKVVVDCVPNVRALAEALTGNRLEVLIDIDPGIHRTGVRDPASALDVVHAIFDTPNLIYSGVQFYCGAQQHIASYVEREASVRVAMARFDAVVAELTKHGAAPAIRTGGGTGTHRIDAVVGAFNEWQCGSYVFMDRQYADCELAAGTEQPFAYALFVDARVVSANHPGLATLDAGFKALASDAGAPKIASGAPPGTSFVFMGDEHGALRASDRTHTFVLDAPVRLAVPHCDPTVNLYDVYHVVRGEMLIDVWPVTVRGRGH